MPIAHVGHWIWELLSLAPIILLGAALIVAEILHRRDPERFRREADEEAERELDEILSS